ncbi:hypothetical protein, partial [Anaerotruncus colihominis]|uniref:hypothetical protein n=1 Tax=Anaerotruncus colihominis TaxID=169435 RepID=UPI0026F11903
LMSKANARVRGGSKLGRLATRQGPGAISCSGPFLMSKATARVRGGSKLGRLSNWYAANAYKHTNRLFKQDHSEAMKNSHDLLECLFVS